MSGRQGDLPVPGQRDKEMGVSDCLRCKVLVAGAPTCAAQGVSPGAEFWLFAPQQQAADSFASIAGWVGSDARIGSDEKTAFVRLSLLWRKDEDY